MAAALQFGPEDKDLEKRLSEFKVNENLDNFVLLEGVPVIDAAKEEKLVGLLRRILKLSPDATDAIWMPRDASGMSKGYCFVEFPTVALANAAVRDLTGYKLDAKHTFRLSSFADIDRCLAVPSEFKAPEVEPFVEREHLTSWLLDPQTRDQFVTRQGDQLGIFWASKSEEPEMCTSREHWTESYVTWSPRGSYMTTIHRQGIALWGGPAWKKIVKFPHNLVRFVDYSPDERCVVTFSAEPVDPNAAEKENLIIWEIRTGKKVRGFHVTQGASWPMLKWSHDGQYVARVTAQGLGIYELPSMALLDKKSIKVEGLRDFAWSPTDNLLAYWTPDIGEAPARVSVLQIPSRTLLRAKNLFNVADCKLQWHPDGDFLAVKVDRRPKSKTPKPMQTTFEMFRVRDKDVPVEPLEIKDPVVAFAWEPKNDRFGVVHGENPQAYSFSFYTMDSQTTKVVKAITLIKTLERKPCNRLYWSPKGQFVVLAGLSGLGGQIEFWNVDQMELMGQGEHLSCSEVEWDPSGRYVATYASAWRTQMEHGYILWDFKGKQLISKQQEKFYQLLWRPRPKTLLTKERQKEIKKNLKEYSVDFKKTDEAKDSRASRAVMERRRRIMDEWADYRKTKEAQVNEQRAEREKILGRAERDEEELIEETVEELIEETRVVTRERSSD